MYTDRKYRFPYSKFPAVRLVVLFISGILVSKLLSLSSYHIYAGTFSVALVWLLSEWGTRKTSGPVLVRVSTVLFMLLVLLTGGVRYTQSQKPGPLTIQVLQKSDWDKMEFLGIITSVSVSSSGKQRAEANIMQTALRADLVSDEKYVARLLGDEFSMLELGDTVSFQGTVIPIAEVRNPHQFDYKAYLKSQDIYVQIKIDSVYARQANQNQWSWLWWRKRAIEIVDQNFDAGTAPTAKALLLGYKQDLAGELKTAYARAGLSHIMAVSGLHVGFIVAPFWLIIPYFWTKKRGRMWGFILFISILWLYAGLTGFSASVMRASVTAAFLTYGKLNYKSPNSINLTATAALVLLLINPERLFEIGFQLSFAAVLIILLVMPAIQQTLPYWARFKWYSAPFMVVVVSLVVQIGLYPVQVYYFGEISLVSPLANALFVPVLGLVVPVSLLCVLISAITPTVGFIINYPFLLFLKGMNLFVMHISSLKWAWMKTNLGSNWIFLLWLMLIFFIATSKTAAIRWKYLLGIFAVFAIMLVQSAIHKFETPKLEIVIFDVGQGDASFIKTPNGKTILIDTGVWSPNYSSGRSVLLPFLESEGITKLDAVILSHPHSDHIGGIMDLINGVEIDHIYNSGYEYDSEIYIDYISLAHKKRIPVSALKAGEIPGIDPAIIMLVMAPNNRVLNNDPNQHSIVIKLIYGENEFLFTGDAGEDEEEYLVEEYAELLESDFLKVGHHGSRTSSGRIFLEKVRPTIAVVSLGENNRYKHPHKEAVWRLKETESALYFTSRDKALIFESDGKEINKVNWDN